jgi:hypothetical protein
MGEVPVAQSPAGAAVDRAVAVVCVGAGAAATWLLAHAAPDPRGLGTHEQLGLRPCAWPTALGVPCPTCGITTAACHLVHLSPLQAVLVQPFGAALAAAGLALSIYAGYCLLTGRSLLDRIVLLPYGRLALWALALFAAAWLYKYLTFAP